MLPGSVRRWFSRQGREALFPKLTLEPCEELLILGHQILGQCPMNSPPWPTESYLPCVQQFLFWRWAASCLEGLHTDRKSKRISVVDWFACSWPLYWGLYQLTDRGQWPSHMVRQRAMENWPLYRMPLWVQSCGNHWRNWRGALK